MSVMQMNNRRCRLFMKKLLACYCRLHKENEEYSGMNDRSRIQIHAASFSTKIMYLETSPDLRFILLAALLVPRDNGCSCVHHRLQWRDRWGITPHSVFPDPAEKSIPEYVRTAQDRCPWNCCLSVSGSRRSYGNSVAFKQSKHLFSDIC